MLTLLFVDLREIKKRAVVRARKGFAHHFQQAVLRLIPEAITFSIIAGVDPKVGLYASFSIATLIAFFGGRRAMISAITGAIALVMVTLVKTPGLDYGLLRGELVGNAMLTGGVFGVEASLITLLLIAAAAAFLLRRAFARQA